MKSRYKKLSSYSTWKYVQRILFAFKIGIRFQNMWSEVTDILAIHSTSVGQVKHDRIEIGMNEISEAKVKLLYLFYMLQVLP